MATKSLTLNFLWSTVIQFLWKALLFAFPQQQKMSSTSCNHSTNKYELCFNIDSLQKEEKPTTALPRNVFDYEDIHCTYHWQSLGFFFAQTFWCVSTGRRELPPALSKGANCTFSQSARSPETPQRGLADLKGITVWEFITVRPKLYLSHLFLPLWHWENCSQSLGASLAFLHPIHHETSLSSGCTPSSPVPSDRLSAAFISCVLPPCTPVFSLCLLQLPSAQEYITGDSGGRFSFLCFGVTGIGREGRRAVICDCKWSLPAVFLHKAPCSTSWEWVVKQTEICDQNSMNLRLGSQQMFFFSFFSFYVFVWMREWICQPIFKAANAKALRIMKNECSSKCLAFLF